MTRAPHHGWGHQQARAWYIARYRPGTTRCAIGNEPLTQPPRYLDLAHDDRDPTGNTYLGLACRKHNRGTFRNSPRWKAGKRRSRKRTRADDRETQRQQELAAREATRQRQMRRRVIAPRDRNGS